ncbi:MAG: DISARM system phospholipase D-like protein DrmC, partial [Thermoleophilaceae bacterium]
MSGGSDLVVAVGRAVAQLSPGALEALVDGLRAGIARLALPDVVATAQYRDVVNALVTAWPNEGGVAPEALALALDCAAERQREAAQQALSIVWTGPATGSVPVRRTDQALLELIRGARRRLIVVSFAVYKVPELADALVAASHRGVSLAVILESPAESGGKVSFDMTTALGIEGASDAAVYTWPLDQRPVTSSGSRAS